MKIEITVRHDADEGVDWLVDPTTFSMCVANAHKASLAAHVEAFLSTNGIVAPSVDKLTARLNAMSRDGRDMLIAYNRLKRCAEHVAFELGCVDDDKNKQLAAKLDAVLRGTCTSDDEGLQ